MSDNRRGVFLGCFGLLLVLAFFIGVPTFIYFQFFHDQETDWSWGLSFESKTDFLELGEDALLYGDPYEAIGYADSALAEGYGRAYDLKLRAQIETEDWEGILVTASNIMAMADGEDQMWVIRTAAGYLPSPEADESLEVLIQQLAYVLPYEDWESVSYDLEVLNPKANLFFLENFRAWRGEDQYVWQKLVAALQDANRYEEAIIEGNSYLASYRNDDVMLNNLGYCYYRLRDFDNAREYFNRAAELGNESAQRNLEQLKESRSK